MGVRDRTVGAFLDSVAAATPTPGGGSVAALAGALSVALSRMVAGLARDKKGYEGVQVDLGSLEDRAAGVQARLEALVEEDARAYEEVLAAMRLPRATAREKAARVDAMQAAYRGATEVPLRTVAECIEALEIAAGAAEKGNRGATTDAGVAILLADAGARAAGLNCRVNLASIRDEAFRDRTEARLADLNRRADVAAQRGMALVESRI